MTCPLDCEYLRDARRHEKDARRHEKAVERGGDQLPDTDIRVTDDFLRKHEDLLTALAGMLCKTALETPGAVDSDVRDALGSLVRTYRTLVAGVYYDTLPENAVAARVFRDVQEHIRQFRDQEQRQLGIPVTRDGDLLRSLVFLEQAAFSNDNGRSRGRAFIDLLGSLAPVGEQARAAPQSLLVLP